MELDDTINWRFSTNHPAATTKRAVPEGSNATLRYVVKRKDGRLELRTGVPAETCRFMFFRVVRRRKGETQGFNLAIELYQELGAKYKDQPYLLSLLPEYEDRANQYLQAYRK